MKLYTRRSFAAHLAGGSAGLWLLALAGCAGSESGLTIALTLLIGAAETAVNTLGSLGTIPVSVMNTADAWLTNVTTFIDFIESEVMMAGLTVLQKADAIAQEAVTLGIKQLPPGLPTAITTVLISVLNEVTDVLSSVSSSAGALVAHGINSPQTQRKMWNGKLSRKDRDALADIKIRNAAVKVKLSQLKR